MSKPIFSHKDLQRMAEYYINPVRLPDISGSKIVISSTPKSTNPFYENIKVNADGTASPRDPKKPSKYNT